MSITVFGGLFSHDTIRVLATLDEKGLEYDYVVHGTVDDPPDWQQINGRGEIPFLRHGDFATGNPLIICHYVDDIYPGTLLRPEPGEQAARVEFFERYAQFTLGPSVEEVVRQRVLSRVIGAEIDEAAATEAWADITEPHERLNGKTRLDYLERSLDGHDYLVGDALSLADIATAALFAISAVAGCALDSDRYPHLSRFVDSMLSRESFAELIAEERDVLASAVGDD